ncbi:MAG: flagellar basal body protein [Acidimicrobiia bacterium]|nr:flagellar basal body protein [Acidimicrobiia bacterium]
MVPISDQTMAAIEYAMNALTVRAEVIANNVANSEVPDFQASKVSFEDQLRRALDDVGIERVRGPEIQGTGDPVDAIGNNVNIESEIVGMMQTNLLQQAMVEAFNFKAGLLRSAIGGA